MNDLEMLKSWYEALVSVRPDDDELEYVFVGEKEQE